jgi:hypothetical protein
MAFGIKTNRSRGNRRDGSARCVPLPACSAVKIRTLLALFILLPMLSSVVRAIDSSVWQVTPYRIYILTAFEQCPELTPAVEADIAADLTARIEGVVGAPWDAAIVPAPDELRRTMLYRLDGLSAEEAAKVLNAFDEKAKSPKKTDKFMLLTVKSENGALQAAVREFDVRSQQLGPTAAATAWHLGKLRDAALDAVLFAFSPLANIDAVDNKEKTAVLRLQAAALPSRDPALAIIRPGMIFRPYIRLNDRDGKVKLVTPQEWTFLIVEEASPEHLNCRIVSGMAVPLHAKSKSRREQIALAVHPSPTPTVLTVKSRTEPKTPLADYEVYDSDLTTKETTLLARTDWRGQVTLRPDEKKPLRLLLIKYGSDLLARIPVVPGLDSQLTANIANMDSRLKAEGYITGLQEEVVDAYLHREILIRSIRAKIEAEDIETANTMFEELGRLPTGKVFMNKLLDEKKRLQTKDSVVQAKIDRLFTDTQKVVEKCFDPNAITELEREFREAKKAGPNPKAEEEEKPPATPDSESKA